MTHVRQTAAKLPFAGTQSSPSCVRTLPCRPPEQEAPDSIGMRTSGKAMRGDIDREASEMRSDFVVSAQYFYRIRVRNCVTWRNKPAICRDAGDYDRAYGEAAARRSKWQLVDRDVRMPTAWLNLVLERQPANVASIAPGNKKNGTSDLRERACDVHRLNAWIIARFRVRVPPSVGRCPLPCQITCKATAVAPGPGMAVH